MTAIAALVVGTVTSATQPMRADASQVSVFAAARRKHARDKVNTTCEADAGEQAMISYAALPALAKQIEDGAPADGTVSVGLRSKKQKSYR